MVRDLSNDATTRKYALRVFDNIIPPKIRTFYFESPTGIRSIIKIVKMKDVSSITIVPLDYSVFQFWPRDGAIERISIESQEFVLVNGEPVPKPVKVMHTPHYGGWYKKDIWSNIDQKLVYPSMYDSSGSFIAELNSKDIDNITSDVSFFGGEQCNANWISKDGNIVNWKEHCNRHFIFDQSYSIPYYEAHNKSVFSGGQVIATVPPVVDDEGNQIPSKVLVAFYYNGVLHCVAQTANRYEKVLRFNAGEWIELSSRDTSKSIKGVYTASEDGSRFMAPDGVEAVISDNSVFYKQTVLIKKLGTGTYDAVQKIKAPIINSKFENHAEVHVWPEIDQLPILVTTTSMSVSSGTEEDKKTDKEVPIKLFGKVATSITAMFHNRGVEQLRGLAIWQQAYKDKYPDGKVPDGYQWFSASATPNGTYCSLKWTAISTNSCTGPTELKSWGTLVSGLIKKECADINFYLTVETESGVKGQTDNYSYATCAGSNIASIIPVSVDTYTYNGKITSPTNTGVTWSASGTNIIGSNTNTIVKVDPIVCSAATLSVTGSCGSATTVINPVPVALSLTGPNQLAGTGVYPTKVTNGGEQYVAAGGKAPYTFTSDFNISTTSTVATAIGGQVLCGSGSISVTDSCGSTASVVVAFPNGQWTPHTTNDITVSLPNDLSASSTYIKENFKFIIGSVAYNISWNRNSFVTTTVDNCNDFLNVGTFARKTSSTNGVGYNVYDVVYRRSCYRTDGIPCTYSSGYSTVQNVYNFGVANAVYTVLYSQIDKYIGYAVCNNVYTHTSETWKPSYTSVSGIDETIRVQYTRSYGIWYKVTGNYFDFTSPLGSASVSGHMFDFGRYYQNVQVYKWTC